MVEIDNDLPWEQNVFVAAGVFYILIIKLEQGHITINTKNIKFIIFLDGKAGIKVITR